jgi:nicotinamidase-related amidase
VDPVALLLMDFQAGNLARFGAGQSLVRELNRLAAVARRAGVLVVWVTVEFRAGYPEISAANVTFRQIADSGRLRAGDPDTAIHPDLEVSDEDVMVAKRRVSAFAGSDLDVILRAAGARTLVLAGIATSGVVLSTVRQAADLDYRLVVLSDGCLDSDPEVHRVLTEKVFSRQAEVTTMAAWMAGLAEKAGEGSRGEPRAN